MKKENKTIKVAAIATGAALIGAVGVTESKAASLLEYETLGTGAELRSNLITADAVNPIMSNANIELECGEGKCGEGKCGEGKCGEKSDKKADTKATKTDTKTAKKVDSKSSTDAKAKPKSDSKEDKKTDSPN